MKKTYKYQLTENEFKLLPDIDKVYYKREFNKSLKKYLYILRQI